MKDKLVVVLDGSVYRIQWQFVDDTFGLDYGTTLGEESRLSVSRLELLIKRLPRTQTEREDSEHAAATLAIFKNGAHKRDNRGFYWESKSVASRVLRVVNAARREFDIWCKQQKAKTPLPDWAVKALAAKWKPPKGWEP